MEPFYLLSFRKLPLTLPWTVTKESLSRPSREDSRVEGKRSVLVTEDGPRTVTDYFRVLNEDGGPSPGVRLNSTKVTEVGLQVKRTTTWEERRTYGRRRKRDKRPTTYSLTVWKGNPYENLMETTSGP